MLIPEPTYKGPESIVYFRGNTRLARCGDLTRRHETVQPGYLVQMLVALIQLGALLHDYMERLLESHHLEKLEVLLRELLPLQLGD